MKRLFIPITFAAIAALGSCSDYDNDKFMDHEQYDQNRRPYTQDSVAQDSAKTDTTINTDTIADDSVTTPVTISGEIGGYSYVDLGLPSGIKWATSNVGATAPVDYGKFYAWGETDSKTSFTYKNYKYYNDSLYQYTKYTFKTSSSQKAIDSLIVLDSIDDAATINMGSDWRMPTKTEMKELVHNCKWVWTSSFLGTNIAGYIGTSNKNGNKIFLPASGFYNNNGGKNLGEEIAYWTASDCQDTEHATSLYGKQGTLSTSSDSRLYGMVVRAVSSK